MLRLTKSDVENGWQSVTGIVPLPKVGCEKCVRGHIPTTDFNTKIPCDCLLRYFALYNSKKLFTEANIPKMFANKYLMQKYKDNKQYSSKNLFTDLNFEQVGSNWIYISGGTGSGKTYLAVLACQIALMQEKSVYFSQLAELLDDLRPDSANPTKRVEILAKIRSVDLCVFDDIGQEKSSQWVQEQLYLLVNGRYALGKPTIFTSNIALDELKNSVTAPIFSRIKGNSMEILLATKTDKRLE